MGERSVRRVLLGWLSVCLALAGLVALPGTAHAADTPVTLGTPFSLDLPGGSSTSFTFSGTAGRRVILRTDVNAFTLTSVTLSKGDVTLPAVGIYSDFTEAGELPSSGTWRLTLQNLDSAPLVRQVTLTAVADLTRTLTAGQATTLNFTDPGQNARLTFPGTAGQKLTWNYAVNTLTGRYGPETASLLLIRPDGSQFGYIGSGVPGPVSFDSRIDATGTWTAILDPSYEDTGRVTLTLFTPVDRVVPVTAGQATTVRFPGGGADVRLRISAQKGQRITLAATQAVLRTANPDWPGSVNIQLLDPSGAGVLFPGSLVTSPATHGYWESSEPVPSSGVWTILLDAASDTTGSLTVKPGLVTDTTGSLTLGASKDLTVVAGRNFRYTLQGKAGQRLVTTLTRVNLAAGGSGGDPASTGVRVTLLDQFGGEYSQLLGEGLTYGEGTLPQDGTYTVLVDPRQDTAGTATLTIREPKVTTTALPVGQPVTATIRRGDAARYTFPAVAGRPLATTLSRIAWSEPGDEVLPDEVALRVLRPDGSVFAETSTTAAVFFETAPLDAGGRWALEIDPVRGAGGRFTFTARQPADITGTLTPGTSRTTTIGQPGQQARYTFTGVQGRVPVIDTTRSSWTLAVPQPDPGPIRPHFVLHRPDGSIFGDFGDPAPYPSPTSSTTRATLNLSGSNNWNAAMDVSGTWTLVVDPPESAVGSQTFTLRQTAPPPQ